MSEVARILGTTPPWWALAGLVAWLGAFVALDMARLAWRPKHAPGIPWLAGAGLALGTGICSAVALGLAAQPSSYPVGHHPALLWVWLTAAAMCALGLGAAGSRKAGTWALAVGAGSLGVGMVLPQVGVLLSIGAQPGLNWQVGQLFVAVVGAVAASALALALFALRMPEKLRRAEPIRQGLSAALLVLAMLASQTQAIAAADLSLQAFSRHDQRLSLGTVGVLASFGSMALLLAMLVVSRIGAHRRADPTPPERHTRGDTLRDALTGLPSRQLFEGTLAQAVRRADAGQGRLALLSIDLDGFKAINQAFGHAIGDQLLSELARRLRALAQPHMVSRMAGDVFLMLLATNPDKEDAAALAAGVLASLGEPCKVGSAETSATCSIGIAMYPEHGALSTLIVHAEAAMRASKANGGATYSFFELRMLEGSREQGELLRDLRQALAKQQLELYYQPKIHAPSGEITGAEALMRWHHPKRGMVSPVVFIPLAERFGLIDALGNWVIETACAQVRAWCDEGLCMRVAINLSVHQLRDPKLPERIDAALKRYQVNPELLTCEITESVAMEDAERTIQLFARLAAVGVSISIDDFGTGYSSLSYLRKLPASELKIDRSFVLDLEGSPDARAVVDAVIKLAQALGLKVVAEGVETDAQQEILRGLGCNELQGYLFAKPMSAKALKVWAMDDEGPRSMTFRASLFRPTSPAEVA